MVDKFRLLGFVLLGLSTGWAGVARTADDTINHDWLKGLDAQVLSPTRDTARSAVRDDTRERLRAANRRETAAWHMLRDRADWESYRQPRIEALTRSLGHEPASTAPLDVQVVRTIDGDGYRIENLNFESRPGVRVSANRYLPARPGSAMPGLLIIHSHHAPKHQGELQAMGIHWARSGAVVLVLDQFGHGERRLHGFAQAGAYPGSYRPERQDYYFRFHSGMQLQWLGESLIGWIVGDVRRGVDLLLSQPGIDAGKIVLLGAVAGGGDPAGVAAALDTRITCAVPFNFGGYEPEDVYPLPENAEETFHFTGSGSWESTRNLALSARDGFQPWMIIGTTAPRHLIYAHEFRWDQPRDPVWKRLQTIFGWYEASDRLNFVVGQGTVRGRTVTDTHCTNIGTIHRSQIYPALQQWFQMPIPAELEAPRYTIDELRGWPGDGAAAGIAALRDRAERLRRERTAGGAAAETTDLASWQTRLAPLLGPVDATATWDASTSRVSTHGATRVTRIVLERPGEGTTIPLPLLICEPLKSLQPRTIVAFSQAGKQPFLDQRPEVIARLLESGTSVVLADLRGTGETEPSGEGRGRTGGATSRSSSELMLGRTTLGLRIGDLRAVLAFLRQRGAGKQTEFVLWGESFAPANDPQRPIAAPADAEQLPGLCEPLGDMAGLFTLFWEPDVRGLVSTGGLERIDSIASSPYFYVPHDVLIPGLLRVADLDELRGVLRRAGRTISPFDQRTVWNHSLAASPSVDAVSLTTALHGAFKSTAD